MPLLPCSGTCRWVIFHSNRRVQVCFLGDVNEMGLEFACFCLERIEGFSTAIPLSFKTCNLIAQRNCSLSHSFDLRTLGLKFCYALCKRAGCARRRRLQQLQAPRPEIRLLHNNYHQSRYYQD
jgi:hypothetical protein